MFYTLATTIFSPQIFVKKRKKFKSTPLFFKLLLKQELKKSIRMFKNVLNIIMVAMATYYFLKIIVKMKIGQMKPIILKLFLKQELKIKKYIRNVQSIFYTYLILFVN